MSRFSGLLRYIRVFGLALLIVGLFISAISIFTNLDDGTREKLISNMKEDPAENTGWLIAGALSYQFVTPAFEYEWVGDPNTRIWYVEEMPFLDSRDIIPLYFFWALLFLLFTKPFWKTKMAWYWKGLVIFLVYVLGTLLFWLLFKFVLYYLMLVSADQLGIDRSVLAQIRADEYDHTKAVIGIGESLVITFFFMIVLFLSLLEGKKNDD